jgi:hypothetical protein
LRPPVVSAAGVDVDGHAAGRDDRRGERGHAAGPDQLPGEAEEPGHRHSRIQTDVHCPGGSCEDSLLVREPGPATQEINPSFCLDSTAPTAERFSLVSIVPTADTVGDSRAMYPPPGAPGGPPPGYPPMVYPGMIPGMPPPIGVPPFAVSARANLARSSQPFIG